PMSGRCYTFSPLGYDMPLFNQPQTETDIIHLSQEINLPAPLRSTALVRELTAQQQDALAGKPPEGIRYFDSDPVLQIFVNRQPKPIPPEEILICPLKQPESDAWLLDLPQNDRSLPTKVVAVDPEAGRLLFLDRSVPKQVEVSYLYGFSGDIGGGSYSRNEVVADELPIGWTQTIRPATSADTNPLAIAIQTWNLTVQTWQGLRDQLYIPLAKLTISDLEISRQLAYPRFRPGIIRGLQVVASPGRSTVVVTPGAAVDRQGRLILLNRTESLTLQPTVTGPAFRPEHLLVIAYHATQKGQHWQLQLLPEAAIEGYAAGTFILLQRLNLDKTGTIVSLSDRQRPRFAPGLASGLQVNLPPGKLEAIVSTGTAIDARGRVFTLMANYAVDLTPHQGQSGLLAIVRTGKGLTRRWQIEFLQPAERDALLAADPEATVSPLADLDIPQVVITAPPDVSLRTSQIQQGLEVIPLAGTAQVKVTAGRAIDRQKRKIKLENDYQVDLSAYAGQTVVLFVAYPLERGLPLTLIAQQPGGCWKHLGVVPLDRTGQLPWADPQPNDPQANDPQANDPQINTPTDNVITLHGNGTYEGDLSILIPANRRLQIIAADGDRPHIRGNLSVRGIAGTSTSAPPGELWLDGLLLEGNLTVLPGDLQRLNLHHCTLVPGRSRLTVTAAPAAETAAGETGDMTLIAFILYCLTLISKLFQVGSGLDRPPIYNLGQLRQIAIQQVIRLFDDLEQAIEQWQCLQPTPPPTSSPPRESGWCWQAGEEPSEDGSEQHNDRLEITLGQTICGAIQLAKTVPRLSLTDSIVDAKGNPNERAITAPGTDVEIDASTILGRTRVRSLEASNTIFTRKVTALRQQVGCVRFSHVPENSQTPRRYRCQPDLTFAETLNLLPKKITALIVNAFRLDLAFAATAGDGIFRFDAGRWTPVNQGLTHLNVTALLDHTEPETGRLILFAGTAGGGLFQSIDYGDTWTDVSHGETNTKITVLAAYARPGIGTLTTDLTCLHSHEIGFKDLQPGDRLRIMPAAAASDTASAEASRPLRQVVEILSENLLKVDQPFTAALDNARFERIRQAKGTLSAVQGNPTVMGTGTAFRQELSIGDRLLVGNTEMSITAIASDSALQVEPPLTQDLSNQPFSVIRESPATLTQSSTVLSGAGTQFSGQLQVGDTLSANGQIRTVQQILRPDLLIVDAAFDLPLTAAAFTLNALLIGTAGGGIFSLPDGGTAGNANSNANANPAWKSISTHLPNQNITAIAINPDHQLFVGTAGSGIFRFMDAQPHSSQAAWTPLTSGLTELEITTLAIDANGYLFAGTENDGIFRSTLNGKVWVPLNQGVTSLHITTMVVHPQRPVSGTIASQGTQVTGTGTAFVQELHPGDYITAADQTRMIQEITSETTLTLTAAFPTDLPDQTAFILNNPVFAGAANGQLFRSLDSGQSWEPLTLGLNRSDITALAIAPQLTLELPNADFLVGTAAGNIMRSTGGDRWTSFNQGLVNVEDKLLIMSRLQPRFTSEQYGDPGYAQLSQDCSVEIRTGAEDESEMGAFSFLKQPQREANLRASLDEHLRFGLEAGIFYIN
ncbi:MAG TPA: hypothetical protein V6C57_03045, partial [Coleofasciculaceae cyanobacterium]